MPTTRPTITNIRRSSSNCSISKNVVFLWRSQSGNNLCTCQFVEYFRKADVYHWRRQIFCLFHPVSGRLSSSSKREQNIVLLTLDLKQCPLFCCNYWKKWHKLYIDIQNNELRKPRDKNVVKFCSSQGCVLSLHQTLEMDSLFYGDDRQKLLKTFEKKFPSDCVSLCLWFSMLCVLLCIALIITCDAFSL